MYENYGNSIYNPMISPYLQSSVQQTRQEVVRVKGYDGATAHPMGPNSSAILLDESGLLVWLVTTDGIGYKTVTPYDITPHQVAQTPNFGDLEARIAKLEAILHEFTEDTTTT